MERIGVTHAGSLIRPTELLAFLAAVDHGRASAAGDEYEAALAKAVDYAVRRQIETGVDVIDDGEMGKGSWITYLYERTSGLENRPLGDGVVTILPASRDRQNFPGAYREQDLLEREATVRLMEESAAAAVALQSARPEPAGETRATGTRPGAPSVWVCTGPMTYNRAAIDRDLVNFKVALEGSGRDISQTFLPVVAPASAY
jgi:5-methyltetrahydropteroyltriglutamate--homocysteine methyltransferase